MTLATGSVAPDFTLNDQNGQPVQLSGLLKSGPVVLYFYPRDHTFGCTRQACAFRDEYETFRKRGITILGVSDDSVEQHRSFVTQYGLPFLLLSDSAGQVRKVYGVKGAFGVVPGRVTFVIGTDGVIHHVFSSQLRIRDHVDQALRIALPLGTPGVPDNPAGSA